MLNQQHTYTQLIKSGEKTVTCKLAAAGQIANVDAVVIGQPNAVAKVTVAINLLAPNSGSQVRVRAILFGNATVHVHCNITASEQADRSIGRLDVQAILVGDDTSFTTVPSLQIYNHSASVTHKLTIRRIQQESISYLNARGLDELEATGLILKSFVETIANRENDTCHKIINQAIHAGLCATN